MLSLPPSQAQVSVLVAEGKSNKRIAYELGLTEGTVKEYINKIMAKLGYHNRTEIALWVIRTMNSPQGQ